MAKEREKAVSENNRIVIPLLATPSIFLLHNLNFYRSLFFYREVYWLVALYLLLPLILFLILNKIAKQTKELSTLITTLLALLFFFFGALQDFLTNYSITRILGKTYILPFLFLLPIVYLLKTNSKITLWLRSIGIALVFFLLSESILLLWKLPNFNQVPVLNSTEAFISPEAERQDSLNIHHLVFDGYTNSATLSKLFDFNNTLDSFLIKEGFYIAGQSKSNYNFTPYSLAATLNLNYLQLTENQLARDFKNYLLGGKVYQQNKIFRFFKNRQYATSNYAVLDDDQHLDKLGTFVPKTPHYSMRYQTLERIVMNPWLWQKAAGASKEMIPASVKASLNYYVHYNQQALQHALTHAPEPHFRFTHFLLPHEPYVFIKGSVDSLQLSDLMNHAKGYPKQIKYANDLIVMLVRELKKNNRNIIILQGDHGFRNYDSSHFSPSIQNETLNAFYFPDQNYRLLYDSISLVNTYRVLLNKYFRQNFSLLKDSSIVPGKLNYK